MAKYYDVEEGKTKNPVVAAAVLNILSESEDQLAELSLIGTRKQYLYQGVLTKLARKLE